MCRLYLQTNGLSHTYSQQKVRLQWEFFLFIESEKVEGVAACIHCSHNVGVGKPFETVAVIRRPAQIDFNANV